MKLLFKQRLFSWFDSYDIYDEAGNTVYVVESYNAGTLGTSEAVIMRVFDRKSLLIYFEQ